MCDIYLQFSKKNILSGKLISQRFYKDCLLYEGECLKEHYSQIKMNNKVFQDFAGFFWFIAAYIYIFH